MSINYTPRTWVTAEVVTAAYMNTEVRDALTGLQAVWTAYTPAITGTTTNPTASSATGAFCQMGKTFWFRFKIVINTIGSGTYGVSLPATPISTLGLEDALGAGIFRHPGSSARYDHVLMPSASSSGVVNLINASTNAAMTQASPVTVANGDTITGSGCFEGA